MDFLSDATRTRFALSLETTGVGWVRATTAHQYADAQRRGNPATLFVSETTGAISDTLRDTLRVLDRESRLTTSMDSTVYGVARSSPPAALLRAPPRRAF